MYCIPSNLSYMHFPPSILNAQQRAQQQENVLIKNNMASYLFCVLASCLLRAYSAHTRCESMNSDSQGMMYLQDLKQKITIFNLFRYENVFAMDRMKSKVLFTAKCLVTPFNARICSTQQQLWKFHSNKFTISLFVFVLGLTSLWNI